MPTPELQQLEMLSSVDDLRRRVERWLAAATGWEPAERCRSLLTRVLTRVDHLRVRLEAPLVVATFGGTGTGKSSLVNALVGEEVTQAGRQRPTTQRPVLIVHPATPLNDLGIPLEDVDLVERDQPLLRDVIILDCPDPDTSEGDSPGSNLDRLRALLPYCDVLLYVSTQQKYRSSRVSAELAAAAAGCRMIFVQTHADLDDDIRDDWKRTLAEHYEVPEVFFVDSRRALQEQQSGFRPTGDFGRLLDMLLDKLHASDRVRIRRANVLDLLHAGLERCQSILTEKQPALDELETALQSQHQQLSRRMAEQLRGELVDSRRLWERRLVSAVNDHWGFSPFSLALRTYNSLGSLIASTLLFRARSTAQLAILGAVQGARWLDAKRQESSADAQLQKVSRFGLDDPLLRETEIVLAGHIHAAEFDPQLVKQRSLDELRNRAVAVEDEFLGDAGRRIDGIIADLAKQHSRSWIRWLYELLLGAFLAFVLVRVAKNFFWDSFVYERELLPGDFYLSATFLLLLICGVLIMHFTRRLRSGLRRKIDDLSDQLVRAQLGRSLFPQLEGALRSAREVTQSLESLRIQSRTLQQELSSLPYLGGRTAERQEARSAL